ncbi:MAG TPA: hypothetical protein VHV49_21865 [Pseudonocardiaceae bacterium]|nr:hypothetical protein [Pseudonocardiaceae bacterium]
MRRGVLFAAVLLTALTTGLEFAHVLEWLQKQHYSGPLYVRLQESLYIWFGNLGGVLYVLAVIATVVLAVLARRDPGSRGPLGVAAGLQVVALASFLAVVYPVNQRLPVDSGGAVPADWTGLRDRWELGHAVGFVLFAVSFVLLLVFLIRHSEVRGGSHLTGRH